MYLGIDAGGSKALIALCDASGRVLGSVQTLGITPASMDAQALRDAMAAGIEAALQKAGAKKADLKAACLGLPCWGESEIGDANLVAAATHALPGVRYQIVNDAQVGWAGSFALKPGINMVCGTGAIAFGMDPHGNSTRCGGWSYHFSDEGSGYWLSKKLLELFCKQSDGRIPTRGPVYELVRERFHLKNDFGIIDVIERDYVPFRDKLASLQMLLLQAARAGDQSAIEMYDLAGYELSLNVSGILKRLRFDEGRVNVSYSGGIFNVGELILKRFRGELEGLGCDLVRPVAPPWIGALMMALTLGKASSEAAFGRLIEQAG